MHVLDTLLRKIEREIKGFAAPQGLFDHGIYTLTREGRPVWIMRGGMMREGYKRYKASGKDLTDVARHIAFCFDYQFQARRRRSLLPLPEAMPALPSFACMQAGRQGLTCHIMVLGAGAGPWAPAGRWEDTVDQRPEGCACSSAGQNADALRQPQACIHESCVPFAGIGIRDVGSSAMDFGLKMMGLLEKHYPVRSCSLSLHCQHLPRPTQALHWSCGAARLMTQHLCNAGAAAQGAGCERAALLQPAVAHRAAPHPGVHQGAPLCAAQHEGAALPG